MRRLLAGAAVVATGLALSLPASAIVGGAPDGGEHPYVGQLLFYVPSAVDSRFDDPGGWFNCSGTLVDPTTVVTAGHCTYATGDGGELPLDDLAGGTDVWFNVSEAPDYSILPPSSTFVPDGNAARYDAWEAALESSDEWVRGTAYTHPEYVDAQFLYHDLGVLELSEPIATPNGIYGVLPTAGYLDQYAGNKKNSTLFEAVGYGLEGSGPKFSEGGDTRRKADQRLVSFQGAYGLRDISVKFSHASNQPGRGGTCFGDSGGPTFVANTNQMVTVTSFGQNYNCTAGGTYRLDQPDDIEFLAGFIGG